MVRLGGGQSATGGPPPPPPLPSSSSSSTLSPLAPPFTLDRRYIPPPPPPNSNPSIDRSSHRLDSLDSSFRSVPIYPRNSPLMSKLPGFFNGDNVLDGPLEFEGFAGVGSDEGSSWMDPSSGYGVSSFPKGGSSEGFMAYENSSDVWCGKNVNSLTSNLHYGPECSDWLRDKHPAVYEENATTPYNLLEASVRVPSSLLKRKPYSQLSFPISVMESCNTFDSNSFYNTSEENAAAPYNISDASVRVPSSLLRRIPYSSDKHPAVYEENAIAPYNISEASVRVPSSLLKRMSYSQVSVPSSVEACHTFDSNSSYDGYMAQLDSCSTNPTACYLPTTCSSSAQYTLSASGTCSSSMDYCMPKKRCTTVRHVNPYKINDDRADHVLVMPKEFSINQNVEGKEGCHESGRANNTGKNTGISVDSFPSGHESATEKSMDHSTEVKSGLKIKHLNLPNAFTSEFALAKPDDSMRNSLETLDQTVDSPCWKGAKASRQSPFGDGETVSLHPVVMESKGCNDADKGQKHLSTSSETYSLSEQVGKLIRNEDKEESSISYLKDSSSVAISPSTQQKCEDPYKIGPDCVKDGDRKGMQCSDICKEQRSEVRKNEKREPEAKDNEVAHLNQEESVISANQPVSADGIANPETGLKCAVLGGSSDCHPQATGVAIPSDIVEPPGSSVLMAEDAPLRVILEALRYLSEMLLSSDYIDATELKDHDHELLELVIDNLGAFSIKNKKIMKASQRWHAVTSYNPSRNQYTEDIAKDSFHDSGLEAAQSQITGLKGDSVMNQSNINTAHNMKGKMHSIGSSMNNDELDNLAFNCGSSDLNKDYDKGQAFEKILEKHFCGQEEHLQSLVYKKLWIDAEAALCSMKYELQLARMKTDIESRRHQTKGKPQQVPRLSNLNSMHDHGDHETPPKAKEKNPLEAVPPTMDKEEEVDPSVMARLRVLKGRGERPNCSSTEEQQKLTKLADLGFTECISHPDSMGGPEIKTDLGFTECISHPYFMSGPQIKTSAVKNTDEKIGQGSNVSGSAAARDFHRSLIQSYVNKPGKQTLSGEQGPSSDWEHVMMEELI